jgi:hypothetical protein
VDTDCSKVMKEEQEDESVEQQFFWKTDVVEIFRNISFLFNWFFDGLA